MEILGCSESVGSMAVLNSLYAVFFCHAQNDFHSHMSHLGVDVCVFTDNAI